MAGPLPGQSFTAVAGHPITLHHVAAYGMGPDLIAIVPHEHNCSGAGNQNYESSASQFFETLLGELLGHVGTIPNQKLELEGRRMG